MSSGNHFASYGESVSIRIISAIAEHRGVDPVSLTPLYDFIDPDTLDALFQSVRDKNSHSACFEFRYEESIVTVLLDGDVTIAVQDAPTSSTGGITENLEE